MSEELGPDVPVPNEHENLDGTDAYAVLRKAQDERRANAWYGVEPGKIATDEQVQAMEDHQMAMIDRDLSLESSEDSAQIKPLDEIQEKQAEQSSNLEYLTGLFQESSDAEHQAAAWQLFDEFIDKHEMTRGQERALRNHLIDVSKSSPAGSENSSDASAEIVEGEEDLDAEAEKILQELKDKRAAEAAAAGESEPTGEESIAEEVSDGANSEDEVDIEMSWETSEDKKEEPAGVYDHEEEERKEREAAEAAEAGEKDPDDEEKERKSLWERLRNLPHVLHYKIDQYFNGGTPEQNKKRKYIAAAIGIGAVGVCIAVGVVAANNANEAAEAVNNLNSVPGGADFAVSHGGNVNPDMFVAATGAPEVAAGGAGDVIQAQLGGSGDTIWHHAEETLRQWGVKPTNANILKLTSGILKDNSLSWSEARHLPNGYDFVINQPGWTK